MRMIGSRENLRLLLILVGGVLGLLSIYTVMVNSVRNFLFLFASSLDFRETEDKDRTDSSHVPLRLLL
jgi:hypothetical protein